ncbi:hypothetical protein HYV21_01850 [Candidatus Microgenomates bacterium]|nr:hypothetical protein [Candidatus Microgenomates bacterium]
MKEAKIRVESDSFDINNVQNPGLKSFLAILDAGLPHNQIMTIEIMNIASVFDTSQTSLYSLLSKRVGIIESSSSLRNSKGRISRAYSKGSVLALFSYLYVRDQCFTGDKNNPRQEVITRVRQELGEGHPIGGHFRVISFSGNGRVDEGGGEEINISPEQEDEAITPTREDVNKWFGLLQSLPVAERIKTLSLDKLRRTFGIDIPPLKAVEVISFGMGVDRFLGKGTIDYGDITTGRFSEYIRLLRIYQEKYPDLATEQIVEQVKGISKAKT